MRPYQPPASSLPAEDYAYSRPSSDSSRPHKKPSKGKGKGKSKSRHGNVNGKKGKEAQISSTATSTTTGVGIAPRNQQSNTVEVDEKRKDLDEQSQSQLQLLKEKEKEWKEAVRPLGKMMVRALREKGDERGVKRVVEWMRERKIALVGREWPLDEI